MNNFVKKYSKWLVSNKRCSLWAAYSQLGLPPEVVLDHIVGNESLLKNVIGAFLEDVFNMPLVDIEKLLNNKVFLSNMKYITETLNRF